MKMMKLVTMIKNFFKTKPLPHNELTTKEKNKVVIILIIAVLCGVCAFTLFWLGLFGIIGSSLGTYDKIKFYLRLNEKGFVALGIIILIIGCLIVPRSKKLRTITLTTIITAILIGISLWSLFNL